MKIKTNLFDGIYAGKKWSEFDLNRDQSIKKRPFSAKSKIISVKSSDGGVKCFALNENTKFKFSSKLIPLVKNSLKNITDRKKQKMRIRGVK